MGHSLVIIHVMLQIKRLRAISKYNIDLVKAISKTRAMGGSL